MSELKTVNRIKTHGAYANENILIIDAVRLFKTVNVSLDLLLF